jgi:arsenate reductase
MKKRILFLCTGNAARSQMAEALARLDHGEALDAVSAGSRPVGCLHSGAVEAMAELGCDISQARSKSAAEFRDEDFDVVVTVCDSAARDCPTWPRAKRIEHWPIEDPSYEPDPRARRKRFAQTRDDLRGRIKKLVESMGPKRAARRPPKSSSPPDSGPSGDSGTWLSTHFASSHADRHWHWSDPRPNVVVGDDHREGAQRLVASDPVAVMIRVDEDLIGLSMTFRICSTIPGTSWNCESMTTPHDTFFPRTARALAIVHGS